MDVDVRLHTYNPNRLPADPMLVATPAETPRKSPALSSPRRVPAPRETSALTTMYLLAVSLSRAHAKRGKNAHGHM